MMRMLRFLLTALLFLVPAASYADEAQPTPAPLSDWSVTEKQDLTGQDYLDRADREYEAGDYLQAGRDYQTALPLLENPSKLDHARERLASIMREGTIVVNCEPSGAEVYLDDTLLGEAPVRKDRIPEGKYTITLKKRGYETAVDKVNIKKGVTLTVEEKLAEARGEIDVTTVPPGVTVLLDGQEAGVTPAVIKNVNAGSHKLELKREYLEPYRETVSLEEGGKKSVRAELPMRLLFIGLTEDGKDEGQGGLYGAAERLISGMPGLKVAPVGLPELRASLKERGLEESSLRFIREQKKVLALEDLAVLSGMMEKSGVRLTLVATLSADDQKKRLLLTLYSGSSDTGDRVVLEADDMAGLKVAFDGFLDRWEAQERGTTPSIGARVVDRASGGPEVIRVLPGYPAAEAGIAPGDRFVEVDDVAVGSKADLDRLMKAGARHKVILVNGNRHREVALTPAEAPVETPPDSGRYLYNLALAEYKDILDYTPDVPAAKSVRSLAALNLANAYVHMGSLEKAAKLYATVDTGTSSGVCTGTALYRLGQAYERLKLWTEAADAYRKAFKLFPEATLDGPDGPFVGLLASDRLKELHSTGLVSERWWR